MPKPTTFGKVELDVGAGREIGLESITEDTFEPEPLRKRSVEDEDTPFRILLMGDFTGRASRGLHDAARIATRRPILVDRDNVETLLGKLGATVRLASSNPEAAPIEISFRDIDDFHPDRLYQRVRIFGELRDLRDRLADPRTFAAAAAALGATITPAAAPAAPAAPPSASARAGSLLSGSLLDEAVEASESGHSAGPAAGSAARRAPADPMAELVKSIVAPHITPKPDPKQGELLKQVDFATSDLMRAILHNPSFQALEAAWRAVYFVARGLETDEKLKLYLLDLTRGELSADLANADDLKRTGLYKLLVEQTVRTPGAHPWAVLGGNYYFGNSIDDLNLLGRIGLLASQAGAPFIAGGRGAILGCKSLVETPHVEEWEPKGDGAEGWDIIRRMPESRYLGLVLPRFLLRLPFGKNFEAPEQFAFEEYGNGWRHDDYCWGNGAFVAAYLLGQSFTLEGWGMRLGVVLNVDSMPLHVYKQDGESINKPCAETLLTQTAAEKMIESGLMPLLSMKDRDRIRLAGFVSIAQPASRLAGPWD